MEREDDFMEEKSEWEGMVIHDMDEIYVIYRFLGQVKEEYFKDRSLRLLEDAAGKVLEKSDIQEKNLITTYLAEDLRKHFKEFLGNDQWESFKNFEKERSTD